MTIHTMREIRPNVWKIRVYAGLSPDGRQMMKVKTFEAKGQRAAERAAEAHATAIRKALKADSDQRGTVGGLVAECLKHRGSKDSLTTMRRRETIAKQIVKDLGSIQLGKLTGRDIDQWYDKLRTQKDEHGKLLRTESTVHHYHRVFAAFLHQGERWGMLHADPLKRVEPPKRRKARTPDMPTPEQVKAMADDATPALGLAIRIAVATGLRRGEILGLRYSDLDGVRLRVERTAIEDPSAKHGVTVKPKLKHDKPRWITIDSGTAEAIRAYRTLAEDGPILASHVDPMTARRPGWLTLAWSRLATKHGLTCRWHDLRHLHVSLLDDAGVPMAVISERIGHERLSTTQDIYNHAKAGRDVLAADVIGRILDGS